MQRKDAEGQDSFLEWDAYGRLRRFVPGDETDGEVCEYFYDALGRRVCKAKVVDPKSNAPKEATWFAWDGDAMVGEVKQQAVDAVPSQSFKAQFYSYYLGSFVPLAMQVQTPEVRSVGRSLYFYQNDPNGMPLRLQDEDGIIRWEAHYSAFGLVDRLSVGVVEQPLRLQGQYFDDESRLHYNRCRYYDAEAGCFISSDPIGLVGGLNPYQFAANVLGWVDPWGLSCIGATRRLADSISDTLKKHFKCIEFAKKLKELMKKENLSGEHKRIELNTPGNLVSDMHGTIALGKSSRGAAAMHDFIQVGDMVFDNLNPQGISYSKFMNDLGLDTAPTWAYNIKTLEW